MYSDETRQLMGTAGALKKAALLLGCTFLLLYGDMFHFFDFWPVVKQHHQNQALATVILKRTGDPQMPDIAEIEPETSRMLRWHCRPHSINELISRTFCNRGLYVLSK